MPKKRRSLKKNKIKIKRQRDVSKIAKLSRLLSGEYIINKKNERRKQRHKKIIIGDDRRFWRPDLVRDLVHKIDGTVVSYKLSESKGVKHGKDGTKAVLAYDDPIRVTVCKRRRDRREYLFTTGHIGSGKKVDRKRRRNENSKVRC